MRPSRSAATSNRRTISGEDEPFEERFPKLMTQLRGQFAEGDQLKAAIEQSLAGFDLPSLANEP